MFPIEVYLILSLGLFFINLVYYLSKVKEFNANYLRYIIPLWIIILIILFFLNLDNYVNSDLSGKEYRISITFISQLIVFLSLAIFMISLTYKDKDIIELNYPSILKSRKGKIKIGKIINRNTSKHSFFLSLEDLEKHIFVCGSTGMGKSNFIQNFLINFKEQYDIPFLLIEFKGEYIFLKNYIKDILILRPGENFSINIFNPEGAHPEIHAERIFDILKSGQFLDETAEYSPQMQKALVDVLTEVCKNKSLQNWEGFYKQCGIYLKKERNKVPMLAQTLISIRNRIRRFSIGPLKAIFGTKTEFKIKELFKKNIIIDLSSIIRLGGEKEDALFFLNMILKYLWDENLTKGSREYKGIKHITVVEDAQYFAPKDLTNKTKLTTYLEDIALLQRGTGECLISIATRPQVSEEILANCGVLVIFKNHMEKQLQCELLNLDEKYEYYLSILKKGNSIIRINSIKRPFLLQIPHIQRSPIKLITQNKILINSSNFKNEKRQKTQISKNKKFSSKKQYKEIKNKIKSPIQLYEKKKIRDIKEFKSKNKEIKHEKEKIDLEIDDIDSESEEFDKFKEFEQLIDKIRDNEKKSKNI